jgi:TonB family protein
MKMHPFESRPLLAASCHWIAIVMLAFLAVPTLGTPLAAQQAQPETQRKAVQRMSPIYPATAKTLNLSGTVRVAVKVAPNGRVVSAGALGGHPLFLKPAVDAVRQWRFETTQQQTEEVVLITFQP